MDRQKRQIFYTHDLAGDMEAVQALAAGKWRRFERLIFVSNWQMNEFINTFNLDPSRCIVMLNAIEPIDIVEKANDVIKLGYWSTPHRGLEILVPVFEMLAEQHPNITLDVFSSFNIYGWKERDQPYEPLFERCHQHPKINYHGFVDNQQIREFAASAHILAYPSIWKETSCLVLIEAMSAGMLCVHSNYGALFETAANWTMMYPFAEDLNQHARQFYHSLSAAIQTIEQGNAREHLHAQKLFVDYIHNWEIQAAKWRHLLEMISHATPSPTSSIRLSI
jgi:glycosyltransferase involved in cell wall biosynthesis